MVIKLEVTTCDIYETFEKLEIAMCNGMLSAVFAGNTLIVYDELSSSDNDIIRIEFKGVQ
jgi:hypothetical protein